MAEEPVSITELHAKLLKSQQDYEQRKKEAAFASREETIALNALNAAQKAFDAVVDKLKQSAPRDSDWKRNQSRTTGEG